MIEIRKPEKEDCYVLASNMREQDKNELEALGVKPLDALLEGLNSNIECHTVLEDGKILAMFGLNDVGYAIVPWMLGSYEIEKNKKFVCHWGKVVIRRWLEKYAYLSNVVHSENSVSIRWLKYLGATFEKEIHFDKHLFIPFHFLKESDV